MNMIFSGKDYREILKEELQRRVQHNSRYSLRAFARDLEISSSRLSEIFSGKQGLSRSFAEKICQKLGYTAGESEYFCDLVESLHGRSHLKKETAKVKLSKYQDFETRRLKMDSYRVISDWYHFAILELCTVKGFQNDTAWIAGQLGIPRVEAQKAISRLIRLGLLIKDQGRFIPTENYSSTSDGIPSDVIQKSHQQILEKATEALGKQSVSERNSSAMIMSIDRNQIGEAHEMIKEFRRKFCKEIGGGEEKNAVYCLCIHFFNLTVTTNPSLENPVSPQPQTNSPEEYQGELS